MTGGRANPTVVIVLQFVSPSRAHVVHLQRARCCQSSQQQKNSMEIPNIIFDVSGLVLCSCRRLGIDLQLSMSVWGSLPNFN